MASPRITPFIPPLPDISGSRTPGAPQPPVIPSPPSGGATIPSWAHAPQHPANYPIYPSTPYTTAPFIPPNGTPAMVPGPMPGGYTPIVPPPGPIYPHGPPPPGVSMDYTGYPLLPTAPGPYGPPAPYGPPGPYGHSTPYGPPPPALHPHSPWVGQAGPMSAPPQPQAPPWQAHRQPYPQFPQPPMTAPMYQGGPPPPTWGAGGFTPGHGQGMMPGHGQGMMPGHGQGMMPGHGQGMMPGHGHGMMPGGQGMMPPDPYMGGHPPWFQQHGMQQGQPPAPPPMQLPQYLQAGPLERANVGDRVDRFMAGNHYGPVLEPFILRVVGAQISVNPLIQPPPDDGSDRPHLQWNMVYPSAQCRKSTDDAHISWHSGRDQPATFPRITSMRIISELFPWILTITARDRTAGVTCGEVIDTLAENFSRLSSGADYDTLSTRRKNQVSEAYQHNRSTAYGVPGGTLGRGMRRLDFLGKDTIYGGIVPDEAALRRLCGDVLPCMFVLNCQRRFALTQEEIREQEARSRAAEAEGNNRRATVMTDSGEEDNDEPDA